jgi:hypothetical protein
MTLPDDAAQGPVLGLSDEALVIIKGAFERFEKQARLGALRSVKPFGLRATEQLCRVAGVLAAFDGRDTLAKDDARNALALVLHSINTWQTVIEQGATDPTSANALRLYEWLSNQIGQCSTTTDILKRATPHSLRGKDTRDAALDLLQAHRLVDREGPTVYLLAPSTEEAPHGIT